MEQPDARRQWYIVRRWQEFGAESRANVLRVSGVAAFYLIHLANYHRWFGLPKMAGADPRYHHAVTALAVGWVLMAAAVHLALERSIFPTSMKFITTGGDILMLTLVVGISDGPRSPLVVGYFLILAVAALRFSLPLIRCATVACVVGYLALVVDAAWFASRDKTVPRHAELIVILALGLAGVTLGAVVRLAKQMADEFSERMRGEH